MYYVYILTNWGWSNRVLYTGVSNNLERRLYEHKNKSVKGFTEKYNVNKFSIF
ncbi:MAG: GIY-YIG nuclease family protein [Desulfosporosinus sp.]|nr:GIY-YIG nuclease family protein [Desulfosporosinus sp.]